MNKATKSESIVWVTGAGSGIGRACALALAAGGRRVWASDINAEAAGETARLGSGITPAPLDVTQADQIDRLVEGLSAEGRLEALIHCAGATLPAAPVWQVEEDGFRRMVELHLIGGFLCLRAACRLMVPQNHGRIILVGSMAGVGGLYGKSPYAAAKAGMWGLVATAAKEVVEHGVTVNLIAPGLVDTPLSRRTLGGSMAPGAGRVEDVAALASFLASPEARHINGALIPLDQGRSLIKPMDQAIQDSLRTSNA